MPAEDRRLQRRDDRLPSIRQVVEVSQSLTALQESPEVLRETLLRIAETAMGVLEADLVDLYQYRADRDEFVLPPIMVGERQFPRLVPKQTFPDDVVVKIARTGERMYAADAQQDPVLTGEWEISRENMPEQRFVVREEIGSSAGIPLQIGKEVPRSLQKQALQ